MSTIKTNMWLITGQNSYKGVGLSADLFTTHDFLVYPIPIVTTIEANHRVQRVRSDVLSAQLQAVEACPPQVILIGMLADAEQIHTLTHDLTDYRKQYPQVKVIYAPVFKTSHGFQFEDDTLSALTQLMHVVDLVILNAHELAAFTNMELSSPKHIIAACRFLYKCYGVTVLATGGHYSFSQTLCFDLLAGENPELLLSAPWRETTPCDGKKGMLANAIAALFAQDVAIYDAVMVGKAYVAQGLRLSNSSENISYGLVHGGWPCDPQDFARIECAQSIWGQSFQLGMDWPLPPLQPFAPCLYPLGVYPVVDSVDWLAYVFKCGIRTAQLRIKDPKDPFLADKIAQAVSLQRYYQAQLFINDHWRLAIELGAYGVHLGQEDVIEADLDAIAGAGLRLGVSTHSYEQVGKALQLRPSYIALGPVFTTQTKSIETAPLGLNRLAQLVSFISDLPTVAIGGINVDNACDVINCGVSGLAIVSAITQSHQPNEAIRQLQMLIK